MSPVQHKTTMPSHHQRQFLGRLWRKTTLEQGRGATDVVVVRAGQRKRSSCYYCWSRTEEQQLPLAPRSLEVADTQIRGLLLAPRSLDPGGSGRLDRGTAVGAQIAGAWR